MKINNRQQLLVIVAGIAVALLIGDRIVLRGLTATWKERSTRLVDLRKKVNDGQSLLRREDGLRSRWDSMRSNTLPANNSLAEQQLLKAFDRWSQDSGVSLLSISPQSKAEGDDYMTLECRVEASGNLSSLSQFLFDIEKDPMALKLQGVELTSRDNDGQQMALGLQVSGLVLTPQSKTR